MLWTSGGSVRPVTTQSGDDRPNHPTVRDRRYKRRGPTINDSTLQPVPDILVNLILQYIER
jgi:hypothetical protein